MQAGDTASVSVLLQLDEPQIVDWFTKLLAEGPEALPRIAALLNRLLPSERAFALTKNQSNDFLVALVGVMEKEPAVQLLKQFPMQRRKAVLASVPEVCDARRPLAVGLRWWWWWWW